jgi:hypothetical protein
MAKRKKLPAPEKQEEENWPEAKKFVVTHVIEGQTLAAIILADYCEVTTEQHLQFTREDFIIAIFKNWHTAIELRCTEQKKEEKTSLHEIFKNI